MSDEPKGREDPGLFDLPLQPRPRGGDRDEPAGPGGGPSDQPAPRRRPRPPRDEPELPLFALDEPTWDEAPEPAAGAGLLDPRPEADAPTAAPHRPQPAPEPAAAAPSRRVRAPAGFRSRLIAAGVDAGVHLGAAGLGLAAALLLGAPPGLRAVPAFALFLLVFSFLYSVVTLAFWGQTPGMVVAGLIARGGGDQPLTFGQTGLRWLAGLATVALAGLPLLVALTGRSLADRLSGSDTFGRR